MMLRHRPPPLAAKIPGAAAASAPRSPTEVTRDTELSAGPAPGQGQAGGSGDGSHFNRHLSPDGER